MRRIKRTALVLMLLDAVAVVVCFNLVAYARGVAHLNALIFTP